MVSPCLGAGAPIFPYAPPSDSVFPVRTFWGPTTSGLFSNSRLFPTSLFVLPVFLYLVRINPSVSFSTTVRIRDSSYLHFTSFPVFLFLSVNGKTTPLTPGILCIAYYSSPFLSFSWVDLRRFKDILLFLGYPSDESSSPHLPGPFLR